MTALRDVARDDAEVQAILDDAAVGHRTAARLINARYDMEDVSGAITSEKSVRRYRARQNTAKAEETILRSPQTMGVVPLPKRLARDSAVPAWTPGIEIDEAKGGEFRTVPKTVTPERPAPDPADVDLLGEFGLSADDYEVVAARKSMWQRADGDWLEARRVSFRKRGNGLGISVADVDTIMSAYNVPLPPSSDSTSDWGSRIVMAPAGDLQLGKQDGGGTAATIERFCRVTNDIRATLHGGPALILPWLGDCIEGIVSQRGKMLTALDMPITEQVRVYRRLMMHQIAMLAPRASKVLIPVVPGNHDETTREQKMPMSDSWAIEGASAVEDWMSDRPEFEHVQFIYPEGQEPEVVVDVGTPDAPYVVGFFHGHTSGNNPAKIIDWWKGQSHGRQILGRADLLVSAHYHHLRVEHTGGNRTWLQIPALDGGSDWYRHGTGEEAPTGLVTVELTPGRGQGWRNLTVHS